MELKEVLKIALGSLDDKFNKVYQQIEDLKDTMNTRFDTIEKRLDNHEERLNRIESNMVQKSSFESLVKILERKEVISKYEAAHVLTPTINN